MDAEMLGCAKLGDVRRESHEEVRFIQGASSPCVYFHPTRGIKTVVHGDDFTSLGKMVDVKWLHESLQKELSCTIRGTLGPPGFPGTTFDRDPEPNRHMA